MTTELESITTRGKLDIFHKCDEGFRSVCLYRGMTGVEFTVGGPTDEGYSWISHCYCWDNNDPLPTLTIHSRAKDCDGPIEHTQDLQLVTVSVRKQGNSRLQVAHWKVQSAEVHDHFAEAAGY